MGYFRQRHLVAQIHTPDSSQHFHSEINILPKVTPAWPVTTTATAATHPAPGAAPYPTKRLVHSGAAHHLNRSQQLRTASRQVCVISAGTPLVPCTNTRWRDCKVALALRAVRHVTVQRRWQAHDDGPCGADDMAAVAGFIVQADHAAPSVLHGATAFLMTLTVPTVP